MRKLYIVITCIFQSLNCIGQINFQSGFGDILTDIGSKVVKTSDGNYCIVAASGQDQPDSADITVYFANYLGEMNSSVKIGMGRNEFPTGLVETAGGDFIISGSTYSSPLDSTQSDIFAIKINSSGDVLWSFVYGGDQDDEAKSLFKTPDNKFIIVGNTKSFGSSDMSALVLKIDEDGNQIWCNVNGALSVNYFNQGDLTIDDQYIFGGGTFNGSHTDNYLVKMSSSGGIIWSRRYGTIGADWISDIKATSDSGFIMAGISSENTAGDTDQCVIKIDSAGGLVWAYNYGTVGHDRSFSIIENSIKHFIICGYSNIDTSGSVINQLVLDEIDSVGNVVWANIYGDSAQTYEGYYVIPGIDDGYAAVGFSVAFGDPNGDALFLKTDDNGIAGCDEFPMILNRNPVTLTDSSGAFEQMVTLNTQAVDMIGKQYTNSYAQNCVYDNIKEFTNKNYTNSLAKLYPNPSEKLLTVETEFDNSIATIFDQMGRTVYKQKFNDRKTTIDISSLSPGIYFIEILSKNNLSKNKFIKE